MLAVAVYRNHLASAFVRGAALLLSGLGILALHGQKPEARSAAASPRMATNLPVRQRAGGPVEIGSIRLDARERTLRFPAVMNMNEGIVEYLLVAGFGKTHESVLRTEVDPYQIHVGMLLLGAHGAGTNVWPDVPTQPLPGDSVLIEVSWTQERKAHRRSAESLVLNRELASPLQPGPWTYTGSRMMEGSFVAQLDGSIVSLITDPNALINNPRPGRENDELWLVNSNGLPALETPLTVTIKFLASKVRGQSLLSPTRPYILINPALRLSDNRD